MKRVYCLSESIELKGFWFAKRADSPQKLSMYTKGLHWGTSKGISTGNHEEYSSMPSVAPRHVLTFEKPLAAVVQYTALRQN